jgi:hypothetical protein
MNHYTKILQRLLNATAFANAGNLRDFQELLEESDRRRVVEKRSTARHSGTAARRTLRRIAIATPLPQL